MTTEAHDTPAQRGPAHDPEGAVRAAAAPADGGRTGGETIKAGLVIIGAGPAGLAAAECAAECGIDVLLIDEQAAPGGQIYRQPPREFSVANWLSGRVYREGKDLLQRVSNNPQARWMMQSTVSCIIRATGGEPDERFTLLVQGREGLCRVTAGAVLIAPGCYDMPAIFPGWNLPGVMATGGIQAFVKSQQLVPGQRFLFVGSHPLQLVVADQIVKAGGEVAGVLFAQSHARVFELLKSPVLALQNFAKLAQTTGILRRLRRAGVPVRFNQTLLRANGGTALTSVTTAPVGRDGLIRREAAVDIECDRLGVCFSFLASSELARQSGAECTWDAKRGGWIARHDEWMQSTVPGIHVAGEITGVAGAEVAAQTGRLAAVGCALALGKITTQRAAQLAAPTRRQLRGSSRFAALLSRLAWPGADLLDQLMTGSATLCKCEEVTVETFEQMLQQNPHIATASAAKLYSRTGMGLCQGRYCQFAVTQLMARRLGLAEQDIGSFTARFPAKPIDIGDLVDAQP